MAIDSVFYDTVPGQGVTEKEWAESAVSRGPLYGVEGPDDFKLTAHPTTPFAVVLSAGRAFGRGVWDPFPTTTIVQCDTVASGATRWDLICAHRDWQPTGGGPTSLAKVNGTTQRAIPATRAKTPGVVDDQPLWLVQWTGGQTQPTAIVDLRCWAGSGGIVAADVLALDYLAQPGALIGIGRSQWRYGPGANGTWGWTDQAGASPWANLTLGSGWSTIGVPARARTLAGGSLLQVTGEAKHSNPSIAEGWIIATFPASMRPVNSGFIPGTTDTYNRAGIYVASASGISVGPRPSGNVVQFNGIASLD